MSSSAIALARLRRELSHRDRVASEFASARNSAARGSARKRLRYAEANLASAITEAQRCGASSEDITAIVGR